jgi:phosphate transport system protein
MVETATMGFRRRYHHQLEVIDRSLARMLGAVVDGAPLATAALLDGDAGAAARLAAAETEVDRLCAEVEASAAAVLCRDAPHGRDLRLVLTALRLAPELERAHDLLAHIASGGDPADLDAAARDTLRRMGTVAEDMWRVVAGCYGCRRPCPDGFADEDDTMDALHRLLLGQVAGSGADVAVAMRVALLARFYERLGDHAVSIARRVGYLAGPRPVSRP